MKNYFITGATGAIGSALVPFLLADPETQVTLLLRAGSTDELRARVEELHRFWQVAVGDTAIRQRVHALRGDVTAAAFGLNQRQYQDLAAECTHIVHSAGNVRMNLPIEQARRSAVVSAQSIIDLAYACRQLEKIEFVSTVGVGGRTHRLLQEQWLTGERQFHNTYEQAKAEAETLIQREVATGLPLTVHRPSMVVGDSKTGRIIHFQVFYHLCEFLSGRRTFGMAPAFGRARLDIVPADYVAKLIAWSSTTPATRGRILHSCSGPELALGLNPLRTRVRQEFTRAGRHIPAVIDLSTGVFRTILNVASWLMPAEARRAVKTLPVFLDYLATEQTFANRETLALSAADGLVLPEPEDYLGSVLGYYLAQSPRKVSR